MCGLVAVISKQKGGMYHSDMKIFTEMLFADQLRGSDGTGIIYNTGKEIKTLKAACASSDFVNNDMYDAAVAKVIKSGNFVVGHNRAATKGSLKYENTHPFREGHITLVHNGTLQTHKELADVEVDSYAICKSIAQRGYKETLKKINGAFTLIWTDSKQKTLNFVRNNQRPLWILSTKDLFIFVSEKGLAQWICDRNNVFVQSTMEVPVGTLYQFEMGTWDKYETQKVDFYIPPAFEQYNNHLGSGYKQPTHTASGWKLGEVIKFVATEVDNKYGVKLLGEYESDQGEFVEVKYWARNEADAKKLLADGVLVGKISHEVFNVHDKTTHLIVTNVSKYEQSALTIPKVIYKTFNGLTLTEKEVEDMDNRCPYCTGLFNKKLIKMCNVTKKSNGKYSALCPDCTSWFNEEGQEYSPQYGV